MKLLSHEQLGQWLRAAGDPSRLRLLALCSEGALAVSELAAGLKQSEPRTSRHLKILREAGLLERSRHGQRVQYRISGEPAAASFVRGLLGLLDRADPLLVQDRTSARETARSVAGPLAESRLGRALAGLLTAEPPQGPTGPALLLGLAHPELMASAARTFAGCTAVAPSRLATQWARAFAARSEIPCRVIQAEAAGGLSVADLVRAGGSFAGIIVDMPRGATAVLPQLLQQARAALLPGGRLWLFERYESLDTAGDRIVEHPLSRLRRLLGDAGLQCEKIVPVEADSEHFLAARAAAVRAAPARLGGGDAA
ncbi:MAG: winged helix-turn-helix transcriptional regulator [Proteobacteria bacterium]|nr:winged helix-turn-helix transcriptional regulator [Pseudomonadota bacterium]